MKKFLISLAVLIMAAFCTGCTGELPQFNLDFSGTVSEQTTGIHSDITANVANVTAEWLDLACASQTIIRDSEQYVKTENAASVWIKSFIEDRFVKDNEASYRFTVKGKITYWGITLTIDKTFEK